MSTDDRAGAVTILEMPYNVLVAVRKPMAVQSFPVLL